MRKAFDTNVPKLRPRLKSSVVADEAGAGAHAANGAETATGVETEAMEPASRDVLEEVHDEATNDAASPPVARMEPVPAAPATEEPPEPPAPPAPARWQPATASPAPVAPAASVAEPRAAAQSIPGLDESPDVQSRRERLLKIKRRVAAAARPAPSMPALPETPARAGESALALVRDLEAQLQRAREVELALRADLDQARTELARGAAEARRAAERLAAVEKQVEEKRAVLEEMLAEMGALEEERDGAVARAQALTALDEERQTLLDGLATRAEDSEKKRAEAEAEVARLGAELHERATDAARVRAALAQVTRERDDLARDAAEARKERDELAEARKALEQVHEALATARTRLS
jgi:hypothetical protein